MPLVTPSMTKMTQVAARMRMTSDTAGARSPSSHVIIPSLEQATMRREIGAEKKKELFGRPQPCGLYFHDGTIILKMIKDLFQYKDCFIDHNTVRYDMPLNARKRREFNDHIKISTECRLLVGIRSPRSDHDGGMVEVVAVNQDSIDIRRMDERVDKTRKADALIADFTAKMRLEGQKTYYIRRSVGNEKRVCKTGKIIRAKGIRGILSQDGVDIAPGICIRALGVADLWDRLSHFRSLAIANKVHDKSNGWGASHVLTLLKKHRRELEC